MRKEVGKMKSKPKSILMILITLGIVFALSSIINNGLNFNADNSEVTNLEKENLKISAVSGKIHVDNNWTATESTYSWCTGSGTFSDPYVIEDLVIDGGGSGSCIWIQNSDVYFNIENCTLYNSGNNWDDTGIKLAIDVDNGQLIDNIIHDNYIGIYLESSDNNTISGNIISNSTDNGLVIANSYNNTILGNTAKYNGNGIHLDRTDNHIVSENILLNNGGGIGLGNTNYTIIFNNTIKHSSGEGISFNGNSNNNWISKNIVNNNTWGISFVEQSHNNTVINNKVHNSSALAIEVYGDNNRILDNIITNNGPGVIITSSNNNISGNTISFNNESGISLGPDSNNNTISENTINHNGHKGIDLDGNNNIISGNNVSNNHDEGINLDGNNNTVIDNYIQSNTLNAIDDGLDNHWDNGSIGNYWDDYPGRDSNDNGIGDTPYTIPGSAGSQDNFPIWWDAPVFSLNSPSQNEYFSINPPNFDISIEEGVVNSTWYTLNGGIANKTFTGLTGTIDQALWNSISEGDVTIRFYANDTRGNMAFEEVIINKDTTAPIITINSPSTDEIFGNNAPGYNLTIIEPNIDTMWYTLDGGTTNFTFTGLTGTIDQTIWDSISEGDVTIRFYVMDSAGYISFEEIEVTKRIPEDAGIPGYNLFFLLGTISVVALIISTKLKKFNK